MTDTKTLLKVRETIKSRKPSFTRQDAHKRNEIKNTGWRRPKGLHSKMREHRRGYKIGISIGWKSPTAVRGMHPSGLHGVLVYRTEDLTGLDPKTQGAIIASTVGSRKRLAILTAAKGKQITILNFKDSEAKAKQIAGSLAARKEAAKARRAKKEQSKKIPQPLEKKVEEAPKSKEEEKREQDKALISREV